MEKSENEHWNTETGIYKLDDHEIQASGKA